MEIGGDNEADDDGNDAKKFDAIITADTAGETLSDFLVKYHNQCSCDDNRNT